MLMLIPVILKLFCMHWNIVVPVTVNLGKLVLAFRMERRLFLTFFQQSEGHGL